jgi:hypothetical protein
MEIEDDVVETPQEDNSLAEALGKAWDSSDSTEEEPSAAAGANETETDEPAGAVSETPTDASAGTASGDPETVPGSAESEAAAGGDAGNSPPVSWNAKARETWADIPEETRQYILQREQEMEEGIVKYADNAKRAAAMDQALAPYQQFFQMNGGTAPTLKGLLATGQQLQGGTPIQKAQTVARLIQTFGVDIKTLDNVLVGQPPPEGARASSEVQQAVQAAVAPYQQFMQQQVQGQQAHQQQVQQTVETELNAFSTDPANEFYNDVKMDMADILDMAANRGKSMSLQEAYERACKLHPEIQSIVDTRLQVASANGKRRASSSVAGSPGGPGDSAGPGDMRGQIENAWDTAGRL